MYHSRQFQLLLGAYCASDDIKAIRWIGNIDTVIDPVSIIWVIQDYYDTCTEYQNSILEVTV